MLDFLDPGTEVPFLLSYVRGESSMGSSKGQIKNEA